MGGVLVLMRLSHPISLGAWCVDGFCCIISGSPESLKFNIQCDMLQ